MTLRTWWKWWAGFDIACIAFLALLCFMGYGTYRWLTHQCPAPAVDMVDMPTVQVTGHHPRAHYKR